MYGIDSGVSAKYFMHVSLIFYGYKSVFDESLLDI